MSDTVLLAVITSIYLLKLAKKLGWNGTLECKLYFFIKFYKYVFSFDDFKTLESLLKPLHQKTYSKEGKICLS